MTYPSPVPLPAALAALFLLALPCAAQRKTPAPTEGLFAAAIRSAETIRNPAWRAIELSRIAEARHRAGDRPGARETLAQAHDTLAVLPRGANTAPALAALAAAQSTMGEFSTALQTAQRLPAGTAERVEALGIVAGAQARDGLKREAAATEALRLRDARLLETPAERTAALAAVAEGEARLGLRERSEEHFTETVEAAAQAGVPQLLAVAQAQTRAGARRGAAATLLRARRAAESGGLVLLLPDIARLQSGAGASRAAAATLAEAHRLARGAEDAAQRNLLLYLVARGMADAGRFDRGLQIARSFPDLGWRAAALQQVASAQAGKGLRSEALTALGEALRIARGLPDRAEGQVTLTSRAVALRAIGETQLRAGQKGLAAVSLEEARRSARTLQQPEWRALELAKIAAVQARAGLRQDADATLEEAQVAATRAQGSPSRPGESEPLLEIVRVRVLLRQYDEALELAAALRERPEARDATLSQLVPVLLRERRYEDAERFAAMLVDERAHTRALLAIAVARAAS